MINVYIIIVTYNGMHWLPKCLSSCGGNHIIVVDNNSTDESVSYIKSNHPDIILLEQSQNLGFGAANNIGISHALNNGADYVFLLNQDAYIQPKVIESLINVHKKNIEYGILSPIHLNGKGDNLDNNFTNYLKLNNSILFDAFKNSFSKAIYELPFVNAAAWLLPKKTLVTIGGFDPMFFHYGEDDNYCQRVSFHGFKIGIVPNCYIFHDREFRKTNTKLETQNSLVLKERQLKNKWGNINIDVNKDIKGKKRDLYTLIIKLFIKLRFKKINYYKKELALIKRITLEIFKSRNINSKTGTHYL